MSGELCGKSVLKLQETIPRDYQNLGQNLSADDDNTDMSKFVGTISI